MGINLVVPYKIETVALFLILVGGAIFAANWFVYTRRAFSKQGNGFPESLKALFSRQKKGNALHKAVAYTSTFIVLYGLFLVIRY